ncbi:MAG: hypothetical protein K5651_09605 [Bacteroidales bacterium]|nr:hypothetical protein [Bacteroidales bacterium]
MRTLFNTVLAFAAASLLLVTSCAKKAGEDSAAGVVTSLKVRIEGYAEPVWAKGDKVAVLDNVDPTRVREFRVVRLGKDAVTGKYDGTAVLHGYTSEGASSYRVVSPFSAVTGVEGGKVQLLFPSVQAISSIDHSVDYQGLVCTGEGVDDIVLKPLSTVLKFSLARADVNRIELHSIAANPFAGTGAIDASGNLTDLSADGNFNLTVKPESIDFILPGEYMIPVRPGRHASGWWMNLYTSDDKQIVYSNTAAVTFAQGQSVSLGAVGAGDPTGIYYGSQGGTKTSSTINFYWHNTASSSMPSIDVSRAVPYRIALWRDEDCTDLVVCHEVPANAKDAAGAYVFRSGEPRFLFTGLEPGRQYWCRVTDMSTFKTTKLMTAATPDFTPVTMKTGEVQRGEVILAEDFSEIAWFGDIINGGGSSGCAGYASVANYDPGHMAPTTEGFVKAEGFAPTPITYFNYAEEGRLFTWLKALLPYTRLNDWAETRENSISPTCARGGYLKLGAESATTQIVTPALDCIPQGKSVTLKVQFKAAYPSYTAANERFGMVALMSGTANTDHVFTPSSVRQKFSFVPSSSWGAQTFTFPGVCRGDRIAIGGDREAAGTAVGTQLRICIDDIILTVEDVYDPRPSVMDINFSTATLILPRVSAASRFSIWLNDSKVGDTTAEQYALANLVAGTDYTVTVKGYDGASSEVYAGSATFTTPGLRQNVNSVGPTFLSIGWDQIFRTETNGIKQAYQIQVCTDAACSNVVYDFVPQTGQNNGENSPFGNGGVLGKASGVNQGDIQGGYLECPNYMTPTAVSVGGLDPNTTYYVRIRTRKSVSCPIYKTKGNLTSTVTLTHALGDGAWSSAVAMRTEAVHEVETREVIRCGFDDFCVHQDYANRAPGSVPYAFKNNVDLIDCALSYKKASNYNKELCFYVHNTALHQTDTWRLTKETTESEGCYNGGTTWADRPIFKGLSSGDNIVAGDFAGWFCGQLARPMMGQLGLENVGCFVATPQLNRNLSASGTACTLSFYAVARLYYDTTKLGNLTINIWRNSTKTFDTGAQQVVIKDNLYPWAAGASSSVHFNDYSKRDDKKFFFDLTLYPGDAVWIQNGGSETIIIDDILIMKK